LNAELAKVQKIVDKTKMQQALLERQALQLSKKKYSKGVVSKASKNIWRKTSHSH